MAKDVGLDEGRRIGLMCSPEYQFREYRAVHLEALLKELAENKIDAGMGDLVILINACPNFFTYSCCGGHVHYEDVFFEGDNGEPIASDEREVFVAEPYIRVGIRYTTHAINGYIDKIMDQMESQEVFARTSCDLTSWYRPLYSVDEGLYEDLTTHLSKSNPLITEISQYARPRLAAVGRDFAEWDLEFYDVRTLQGWNPRILTSFVKREGCWWIWQRGRWHGYLNRNTSDLPRELVRVQREWREAMAALMKVFETEMRGPILVV